MYKFSIIILMLLLFLFVATPDASACNPCGGGVQAQIYFAQAGPVYYQQPARVFFAASPAPFFSQTTIQRGLLGRRFFNQTIGGGFGGGFSSTTSIRGPLGRERFFQQINAR